VDQQEGDGRAEHAARKMEKGRHADPVQPDLKYDHPAHAAHLRLVHSAGLAPHQRGQQQVVGEDDRAQRVQRHLRQGQAQQMHAERSGKHHRHACHPARADQSGGVRGKIARQQNVEWQNRFRRLVGHPRLFYTRRGGLSIGKRPAPPPLPPAHPKCVGAYAGA
jgi:hypothetical protein